MKGKILTLLENSVRHRGLLAEHGISFYIEFDNNKLLFDVGQSGVILRNAQSLGINLEGLSWIALSHNHYDHTGGLLPLLKYLDKKPKLFAHPDAFLRPRYIFSPNTSPRDVGNPYSLSDVEPLCEEIVLQSYGKEIVSGIFLTGEIERKTPFEDVGDDFRLANGDKDPIWDDQSLVIDAPQGLMVLLGCGHSGLVNTLLKVRELFPSRPIEAVIGGFHLGSASPERLKATADALKEFGVNQVIGGHCTGWKASLFLSQNVKFFPLFTGMLIEL
ncbi:MBL fold metallo-hydrolase [bacterium]|nr:MBL fold metallo-hydrolase [bacterium]